MEFLKERNTIDPKISLKQFEDMVDGLLEEYQVVTTKYGVVEGLKNGISSKVGRAKVQAQTVEGAELFSSAVNSEPGKAVLGLVGALAGAVKGAISSVILVPMAVNIANSVKYQNMTEEFEELVKELNEVEYIIKEHSDLLTQINGPVKNLSQKYRSIKGRKELSLAMLDRIVKES